MYYRARYYQPGIGRFISEDPLTHSMERSAVLGLEPAYPYASNSPIQRVDPLGLTDCSKLPVPDDKTPCMARCVMTHEKLICEFEKAVHGTHVAELIGAGGGAAAGAYFGGGTWGCVAGAAGGAGAGFVAGLAIWGPLSRVGPDREFDDCRRKCADDRCMAGGHCPGYFGGLGAGSTP
jgi:uncharacterized protein RhaS with RHS repeats